MKIPEISVRQWSRGEKETEIEATWLVELIEDALAVVSVGTTADVDSLETSRIESSGQHATLRSLSESWLKSAASLRTLLTPRGVP